MTTMPEQLSLSGSRRKDRVGMIEIEPSSGARERVDVFVRHQTLTIIQHYWIVQ
jgi:hypothetical protein